MRKLLTLTIAVLLFGIVTSNAQSNYTTALGLGIDFGDGQTLVGPSVKHFFTEEHAGMGEVTFGDNVTFLTILYQYHGQFPNASGLTWFAGAGPSIAFFDGSSDFFLRPVVGLDFKIRDVPLAFSFDWRPWIFFGDSNDSFEAARFGLGARYTF
ncbi:hypothetical protein [Spongiimicrobium sp. 3-5]|uniref:hypothetical protein n=1 Tax=Spongiimicrobium sp. 3-5 TaxID=3332596 RepID=UPI0039806387